MIRSTSATWKEIEKGVEACLFRCEPEEKSIFFCKKPPTQITWPRAKKCLFWGNYLLTSCLAWYLTRSFSDLTDLKILTPAFLIFCWDHQMDFWNTTYCMGCASAATCNVSSSLSPYNCNLKSPDKTQAIIWENKESYF